MTLIGEGGPAAATVRAIAERAGVTPGLIRHYFTTKEELTRAAYATLMATDDRGQCRGCWRMLRTAPEARLAAFVTASLRPPVVDPDA